MNKSTLSQLFRWQPGTAGWLGLGAGSAAIGLSAAMLLFPQQPWMQIAIRDVGQIFLLGILIPVLYIVHAGSPAEFGLSGRRWPLFLAINGVLAALLLFQFLAESPPAPDFQWGASTFWSATYVSLALCFELIFFYAFLRTLLERAFGIVPAILLTATFYSFHHLSFQPEFGKLFAVGLLYALVYRLGNSALLIFPFFLGIGGLYDVLVQSQVVSPILYPEWRTLYLAPAILAVALWAWRQTRRQKRPSEPQLATVGGINHE